MMPVRFWPGAVGAIKSYVDGVTGRGPFYQNQNRDPGRPRDNIILITLDMVPREFYLELPGCQAVRAPAIEGLRRGHLFFARAFAASPLCSPSRAAYLTGRYPYVTGNSERAHDGHLMHLRDLDLIFPEYLKAAGYHLRHVGKCHVGAHKFLDVFGENDSPWDRWSPPWYDDDRYHAFLRAGGLEPPTFERTIRGRDPSGRGEGNLYGGWLAPQNGRPFPEEATYPAFLVEEAISALDGRDRDRPLYLELDFFAPHQPFAVPGSLQEREAEIRAGLSLPASYRRLLDNGFTAPWPEPRVYRLYRKNWGLEDPAVLADYMTANLLQYELIDRQLLRLFAALRERGLYDTSWVVLLADHGEMNGELGLIDKGAFLNPAVLQVPLVLKPPARHPLGGRARTVAEPVSLLDLAPTVLEIAGVSCQERLDGVSLLATLRRGRRGEAPILCDIWSHVIPNPAVGMVFGAGPSRRAPRGGGGDSGWYLYCFNCVDDLDELYALEPRREIENLAARPQRRQLLDLAIRRLYEVLRAEERFRGYADYLGLTYAERLGAGGDRQRFLR